MPVILSSLRPAARHIVIPALLLLLVVSRSWAIDPEVDALVKFETRGNADAARNPNMIPIEHYEIPLDQLEADISKRIPVDVRDSLIFEKDGRKYVRWLINPEDTKWHKEVEKWLDRKKLPRPGTSIFRPT